MGKVVIVMQKAFKEAKLCRVDYITVTATAYCSICVDKGGNPLSGVLMISDKRAKEDEIIRVMPEFQTVYQQTRFDISASLMLPKILWAKRNRIEVFEKTAYYIMPNDYLLFKLCRRCVTDYLNAVKYHYNLKGKIYPVKLLEKLGISISSLPEVVDIGSSVGGVRINLAENLGLNTDTGIVVTSYDAISSFIGSGVSEEGEVSEVSGTVTVFRTLSRKKAIKDSSKIYSVPFYKEYASIIGGSNIKRKSIFMKLRRKKQENLILARKVWYFFHIFWGRERFRDDNARGVFFGLE